MKFPEKVTTYGGPDDGFIRIVDRFSMETNEQGEQILIIDRLLTLKYPYEYIILPLTLSKLEEP
jgi:hypothetical protein